MTVTGSLTPSAPLLLDRPVTGVLRLRLNRPERLNALDPELAQALLQALAAARDDAEVRALVLCGAGRAFSAGADVAAMAAVLDAPAALLGQLADYVHAAVTAIVRMPKPAVAALGGITSGGGVPLALACDLVLMAEDARITMAYTNIGLCPDGGSTYLLPRMIGARRALELFLLNPMLSAAEALAHGLCSRVVPAAALDDEAVALAARLAAGPTCAFGRAKQLVYDGHADLETQLEVERQGIVDSSGSADFAEGVRAFVGKRPPVFRGR